MSTDENGYQLGDEPVVVDGVTYYPFPEIRGCEGCVWSELPCFEMPRGCAQYNFIWRTGFEAVVQWTARAEQKKETP